MEKHLTINELYDLAQKNTPKSAFLNEVISPEIEKLKENLAKKHRFKAVKHRMEIYGIFRTCKSKKMQS